MFVLGLVCCGVGFVIFGGFFDVLNWGGFYFFGFFAVGADNYLFVIFLGYDYVFLLTWGAKIKQLGAYL
ncbi:hypothetical protein, partial [Stenotrophomonas maltophilia]|uniref:hypothetical protein n=1 Tax=Stenotrophomonas maltophilia TaxID=40324 RepID=UPI00313E851C